MISFQSTAVTPAPVNGESGANRLGAPDAAAANDDLQSLNVLMPQDAEEAHGEGTDISFKNKLDSRELAGGFEKSEQLKILYLAQWYNLQKQLRLKLNAFGNNQISRFNGL